jgi:hypothetical protein
MIKVNIIFTSYLHSYNMINTAYIQPKSKNSLLRIASKANKTHPKVQVF